MTRERENSEVVVETKKRKKCDDGELKISPDVSRVRSHSEQVSVAQAGSLVSPTREKAALSEIAVSSSNFDGDLASCCSSNGSSDVLTNKESSKSLDLDVYCVETATSRKSNSEFLQGGETILTSKLIIELEKLESTKMPQNAKSHRRATAEKMPSEVDIDEFFAAAEKDLLKRATKKYNFDFVKEMPLEGRYEWTQQ